MRPEKDDEYGVFGPTTLDAMRQAHKLTTRALARDRHVRTVERHRIAAHIVRQAASGNRSVKGLLKSALRAFLQQR